MIGYLGVNIDITERKMAEAKIKENELQMAEVGWMAKIGGWEFDVATMEGTWTDEVARIHDIDPVEKNQCSKREKLF